MFELTESTPSKTHRFSLNYRSAGFLLLLLLMLGWQALRMLNPSPRLFLVEAHSSERGEAFKYRPHKNTQSPFRALIGCARLVISEVPESAKKIFISRFRSGDFCRRFIGLLVSRDTQAEILWSCGYRTGSMAYSPVPQAETM